MKEKGKILNGKNPQTAVDKSFVHPSFNRFYGHYEQNLAFFG
ncbi:hypothetical protein TEGAF0_26540 [Sediminibacterium sp. TEGAF015]|nr:hypothetical protein TEGAF0_26540 [Sediminibacterium sp. TEGAF015]